LDIRPDDITEALFSKHEGAAGRLADRALVSDRSALPDGGIT
jgi:hypothetical protein